MINVKIKDNGICEVFHESSQAKISTSTAPEYGGQGLGFSSTDLVAAALGSCIGSSLEPVLIRHDLPVHEFILNVEKKLSHSLRKIASLTVTLVTGVDLDETLKTKLSRTAKACPVHRSLHPDIVVEWSIRKV